MHTSRGFDPFEKASAPVADVPQYQPAGDGDDSYIWRGEKFTRVTAVLGSAKTDTDALSAWFGKQACFATLEPLYNAGLLPNFDAADEFLAWCERRSIRPTSQDEALELCARWQLNMREGFRYRDHAADIGRLVHHASYHYALGTKVNESDRIEWFMMTARELQLLTDDAILRWELLGKTEEDALKDLAYQALPYWQNKRAWYEKYMPDHVMVGLQMASFNSSTQTAGTPDEDFYLWRKHWEAAGLSWPFGKERVRVISDDKTTNTMRRKEHALQVAAYARGEWFGSYSDLQEYPVPDYDGLMVLYISREPETPVTSWTFVGEETIDDLFELFCAANTLYRGLRDMPKAARRTKFVERKQRKGERSCPIKIGSFTQLGGI